jgi:hypothetical protein
VRRTTVDKVRSIPKYAGMIIAQLVVTAAVAFVRLHAYAQDRRLCDVAADVVARRLRFHADTDSHIDREGGDGS